MIWAVLDTNVLVSGMGWRTSTPGRVIELALEGRFVLATSEPLLTELQGVLAYPRLARLFPSPKELTRLISEVSVIVEPTMTLEVVEADLSDNRVLEAAVAAQADYIVSGDHHLLGIGKYDCVQVVSRSQFLSLVEVDPAS